MAAALLWGLCLGGLTLSFAETINGIVGGSVTLHPIFSGKMDDIIWKIGNDKLAEWEQGNADPTYYVLSDRAKLDINSAELTISKLVPSDSGAYSAEITFNRSIATTDFFLKVHAEINGTVGGSVTLHTAFSGTSDSIIWKTGSETLVEWKQSTDPTYYRLGDRAKLDVKSADLTISKLDPSDSGMYSAEISVNGKKTTLYFILKVHAEINGTVGGSVTLHPVFSGTSDSIIWKTGSEKLVEWKRENTDPTYYRLGDRAKLDVKSAELTISKLDPSDSGMYSAEISVNGQMTTSYVVLNIHDPPHVNKWLYILIPLALILGIVIGVIIYKKKPEVFRVCLQTKVTNPTPQGTYKKTPDVDPVGDNCEEGNVKDHRETSADVVVSGGETKLCIKDQKGSSDKVQASESSLFIKS